MSAETVANPRPVPEAPKLSMTTAAIIIMVGIIATTLPQTQVMGRLPLQNLLHGKLGFKSDDLATFFLWATIPWYLKPIAGILSDAFPFLGTRRRHYALLGSLGAAVCWIIVAFAPKTYMSLLLAVVLLNVFMVIASTVIGGYLVQVGQATDSVGRLTAVRQMVSSGCSMVAGPLGGFLATGSFLVACGASAAGVLMLFPIAYFFLREQPTRGVNTDVLVNAGNQLKTIFQSGSMWKTCLFLGLFYFCPGFNSVMYVRQTDVLHFSQPQIGFLGTVGGICGLGAAVLYGALVRKVPLGMLIRGGILLAGLGTFAYFVYNSYSLAMVIDGQNGFFFGLAEVALLDLAARCTPKGCEALGFSLMVSVRNLAVQGADVIGSKLSVQSHWGFSSLVTLNAVTTLLVLLFVFLLPKAVMNHVEGTGTQLPNGDQSPSDATSTASE